MAIKGFRGARYNIQCPCGNSKLVVESKKDITKFCSKKCYTKYGATVKRVFVLSNTYAAIHQWVDNYKVKSKECEHCGITGVRLEWANKSHEYKRELDDWLTLCVKCHRKHDLDELGHKRTDTAKFPDITNREPHKRKRPQKLTKEQVIEIFLSSDYQKNLTEKYNLSSGLVTMIKNKTRYWKYTKDLVAAKVKPMYIKLTESDVIEILKSPLRNFELAKIYNVGQTLICNIRYGRVWKAVFEKIKAA